MAPFGAMWNDAGMDFRARLVPAALLAGVIVLTGCGPAGDGGPGTGDVVVHRGNGGDPQTLDPARAQDTHAFNVLTDLYEGLLGIDASGRIITAAAADWTVSEDGLVYRFELREDARWSDGTPVEAEHFVAGMRRALTPSTASTYAFLLHPLRNARAVESGELPPDALGARAEGRTTLVLELEAPAPYLPSVLTMPVAFPYLGDAEAPPGRFGDPEHFVGNGPFLLDDWHPGSYLRLRRNPAYREADSVAVDAVVYHAIADPVAELNRYRAGELDITATVPGSHFSSLRDNYADALQLSPFLALYYIAFDVTEPPFDDPSLRKALSMAIDRETLTDVIGRGERPAFGLVPDGVPGYEPARFDWAALSRDEREARARELYADAGYSAENPLRATLLYDAGDIHETIMLAVSGMWREVLGVDVEFEKREWKYFLATRDDRDDWQLMRFAWTGDYAHPETFAGILHSASPQNLPGYASEHYDRLLEEAGSVADGAAQMALYARAEARMLEDNPLIPLYFFVSKHLVRPGISGFEPNVLDRHPSRYLQKATDAT
jgi:ABC-type oligopeptide transport system substrate-binding subunit